MPKLEVRKIIKLGDSTLCVSLPKSWTENNHLEKGDFLNLESDSSGNMILTPNNLETKKIPPTIIDLKNTNNVSLKNKIDNYYMTGSKEIVFTGDISKNIELIRNTTSELMAFELVSIEKNKLITKVLLDEDNASIKDIISKLKTTLDSHFTNIIESFTTTNKQNKLNINNEIKKTILFGHRIVYWKINNYYTTKNKEYGLAELVSIKTILELLYTISKKLNYINKKLINNKNYIKISNKNKNKLKNLLNNIQIIFKKAITNFKKTESKHEILNGIFNLKKEIMLLENNPSEIMVLLFSESFEQILSSINTILKLYCSINDKS